MRLLKTSIIHVDTTDVSLVVANNNKNDTSKQKSKTKSKSSMNNDDDSDDELQHRSATADKIGIDEYAEMIDRFILYIKQEIHKLRSSKDERFQGIPFSRLLNW